MKSELKLLTTQFRLNSRLKKALWHRALHNETILRGGAIISAKHRPEKSLGANETMNFGSVLKRGH